VEIRLLVAAFGSGPPIKRIVLCPGDRLINEGKIVVEQFLGSRTCIDRGSAIHRCMTISAAMKARAMLVVYWVEVIVGSCRPFPTR
jgi:hypothetical protein